MLRLQSYMPVPRFPDNDAQMQGGIRGKFLWVFLSLLSAVLLILTFPLPGISPFAWVALAPLYAVIRTSSLKRSLLAALLTGVLFNIIYLLWMKEYKHPATLSGGIFAELLFFVFSALLIWALARKAGRLTALYLALGWFAVDYLKTVGFLGFPWGILGYSQYKSPLLIQNASLFGVWGINFLLLYANAALSSVLVRINGRFLRTQGERWTIIVGHLCAVVLLSAAALVYGAFKLTEEKKTEFTTTRVALIQANFDPWSPDLKGNLSMEMDLTNRALRQDPDLVVWSESSVPLLYNFALERKNKYARRIHKYILRTGKAFLFGTLEFSGSYEDGEYDGDFYNVAVYYNEGKQQGTYRKMHLVPFGEWFPYKRLFPFVVRILENAGAGDFRPGEEYTVFNGPGYDMSVLICYEDVFGDLARRFVLRGSDLLINVTNDAWTGSRKAEIQHFAKSIFRTVENRKSLIRAANGGVTACIDPYGRIIDEIELFTADYLVCDVPIARGGPTFYTRFGDLLPRIAWAFVFLILLKKSVDRLVNRHKIKMGRGIA